MPSQVTGWLSEAMYGSDAAGDLTASQRADGLLHLAQRNSVAAVQLAIGFVVRGVLGQRLNRFCQGSRHRPWPTRAQLGIGPPLTKEADEDAVLGMWVGSCDRAIRAHRPGLPPVPLPRVRQAVQSLPLSAFILGTIAGLIWLVR